MKNQIYEKTKQNKYIYKIIKFVYIKTYFDIYIKKLAKLVQTNLVAFKQSLNFLQIIQAYKP